MVGTESNAFDKSIKQSDSGGLEKVDEEYFGDENDDAGNAGGSSDDKFVDSPEEGVPKDQDYA